MVCKTTRFDTEFQDMMRKGICNYQSLDDERLNALEKYLHIFTEIVGTGILPGSVVEHLSSQANRFYEKYRSTLDTKGLTGLLDDFKKVFEDVGVKF